MFKISITFPKKIYIVKLATGETLITRIGKALPFSKNLKLINPMKLISIPIDHEQNASLLIEYLPLLFNIDSFTKKKKNVLYLSNYQVVTIKRLSKQMEEFYHIMVNKTRETVKEMVARGEIDSNIFMGEQEKMSDFMKKVRSTPESENESKKPKLDPRKSEKKTPNVVELPQKEEDADEKGEGEEELSLEDLKEFVLARNNKKKKIIH